MSTIRQDRRNENIEQNKSHSVKLIEYFSYRYLLQNFFNESSQSYWKISSCNHFFFSTPSQFFEHWRERVEEFYTNFCISLINLEFLHLNFTRHSVPIVDHLLLSFYIILSRRCYDLSKKKVSCMRNLQKNMNIRKFFIN